MSTWDRHVLPFLVEKGCRGASILEERQRRVPQASGRTLEIGVGTGLNLGFYDPERVTELVGVDPSTAILGKARERIASCKVPVDIRVASAEDLPFEARSFDSVVMTYTLCSVDDPIGALLEIRRVLRTEGRLIFVEHGLATRPSTRVWQRGLTPVWRRFTGNCHLDRDVPAELRQASFRTVDLAECASGPSWVGTTYEGIAVPIV